MDDKRKGEGIVFRYAELRTSQALSPWTPRSRLVVLTNAALCYPQHVFAATLRCYA
jgi:hypothetical protein